METPRISIITVNYKQPWVTCELLDSIKNLDYPNLETIVVDNDQHYDDSILYRHHLPKVKVINSKENLGFAGANNLGIRESTGDYIMLLNNDTEIENGVLERLIEVLQDDKIGAVSPVLRYFEAPEKIQFAGFTPINKLTGRNQLISELPEASLVDSPYFHGAAVLMPRQVINECGLMPEDYFLYYEEIDWSVKIKEAGYDIKVCTEVSVLHKESITTGKNSPLKVYYQNRNRVAFMNKHAGPASKLFFNLFYHGISMPVNALRHALKGEKKHLAALFKAFRHASIAPQMGMAF